MIKKASRFTAVGGEYLGKFPLTDIQKKEAKDTVLYLKEKRLRSDYKNDKDDLDHDNKRR